MKLIIVALALVAAVAALPAGEYVTSKPVEYGPAKQFEQSLAPALLYAKILRSLYEQNPEGSYNLEFETEDGIVRSEVGELKEVLDEEKKPHKVVVVRGSYSYTNKDGQPEVMNYYADESGYHPEGSSIPKPVSPVSRR